MFMINFRDRENVKPDVPLEPLNLEHFVLPFIFLAVGLREVRARRKFSTDVADLLKFSYYTACLRYLVHFI